MPDEGQAVGTLESLKTCTLCTTTKSLDSFPNDRRLKGGKGARCKSCKSSYMTDYWKRNKMLQAIQYVEKHNGVTYE